MPFSNSENLVNPLDDMIFWALGIAVQNICEFIAKFGVQLTFFMKIIKIVWENQCQIDAFFELWKTY